MTVKLQRDTRETLMDVILLDRVENLGRMGDKVSVRSGYGRNFLIPQGKAVRVTPESLKEFEARRAELEKQAADEVTRAEGRKRTLEGQRFEIKARAGGEGKLYGSIGTSRSEEHTSELQSRGHLVCRLLL